MKSELPWYQHQKKTSEEKTLENQQQQQNKYQECKVGLSLKS